MNHGKFAAFKTSMHKMFILFYYRIDMDICVCSLAKEARLVLVIYGRTLEAPEKDDKDAAPQYKQEEIGWASVQFFSYEG